jgi:hypothetical protein
MIDNYGLYDTIKMCEIAIFLTKPDYIKKIKMIPYYEYIGPNEEFNFYSVLLNIDIKLEKEDEYTQFTWTSVSDYYYKEENKEEVEDTLVCELDDVLMWDLENGEIESFWENLPWNKFEWKPIL